MEFHCGKQLASLGPRRVHTTQQNRNSNGRHSKEAPRFVFAVPGTPTPLAARRPVPGILLPAKGKVSACHGAPMLGGSFTALAHVSAEGEVSQGVEKTGVIPTCHAGGGGFKCRWSRHYFNGLAFC